MFQAHRWQQGILLIQSRPNGPWSIASDKQKINYLSNQIKSLADSLSALESVKILTRDIAQKLYAIIGEER